MFKVCAGYDYPWSQLVKRPVNGQQSKWSVSGIFGERLVTFNVGWRWRTAA